MTDQQRFDAIQRVQNELDQYNGRLKIRTPNLDELSEQGAYFRNAYTPCAVCAPARTSLRTGCTIERHGAQTNSLVEEDIFTKSPDLFAEKIREAVCLDQILVEERGYVSEYYGKWHLPVRFALNKAGTDNIIRYNHYNFYDSSFVYREPGSWGRLYKEYLDYFNQTGKISKTFPDGTQENTFSNYAYYPVKLDARYGMPTKTPLTSPAFETWETSQPNVMGQDNLTEKYTPSGMNGFVGVRALSRLCRQDHPFFLTLSFHNPHAPMVASKKYYDYYFQNRDKLLISPSIIDKMENSGYSNDSRLIEQGYGDPEKVKEWMACYYALVEEVDYWVGNLMDTLNAYPEVCENTMIVFVSDHGEMLGAHSLREKNKFLEESAHVPLLLKVPGKIDAGTVVDQTINTIDLFSTLLDYGNSSAYDHSDGKSLRRFIEKNNYNKDFDEEYIVTEWDYRDPNGSSLNRTFGSEINFHCKKGPYKLMLTKASASQKKDMLYNVEKDPWEMDNLIGRNGMSADDFVIGKTEHLKALLLDWMIRHNGENNIYSDSKWNNREGLGDIAEIRKRRTWKAVDFWVGDTAVYFENTVQTEEKWIRNEWLYFGRTTEGVVNIETMAVEGEDADKFSLSGFTEGALSQNEYDKVKIQFNPDNEKFVIHDARIRIKTDAGEDKIIELKNSPSEKKIFIIDDCGQTGGWEGTSTVIINTVQQQEGNACIEGKDDKLIDFHKVFDPPLITDKSFPDGALSFWFFISDTSLMKGDSYVELGSDGDTGSNMYLWSFQKNTLTEGWNYISLSLNKATLAGIPDLNALNWFRLYTHIKGEMTARLDIIKIGAAENSLPGKASLVYPGDGSAGKKISVKTDWVKGKNAFMHDIYFDTVNPPAYIKTQTGTSFDPGELKSEKTYYWRVDEKNPAGITRGDVWSFTTLGAPGNATHMLPADKSKSISTTTRLNWEKGTFAETHDVYFGTENPPAFIKNQVGNTYTPDGPLEFETKYYWRVDEVNEAGKTKGDVRSFTTRSISTTGITLLSDCDTQSGWGGANNVSLNVRDQKEGKACLQASGDATNDFQRTFDPPLNTGLSEDEAQLVFWYYISDVSHLDEKNQIETGSGGKADIDEYNWQIDPAELKNGWNLMRLDFGDANKMGNPSLYNINWFRIYRFKTDDVISYIDNIRIIDKTVDYPEAGKANDPGPVNNSINAGIYTVLRWTAGEYAESHLVYFGKTNPPGLIGEQALAYYRPSQLDSATRYYWRIDEVNLADTTEGDIWTFTTLDGFTAYNNLLEDNAFKVYPNPSGGIIKLELDYLEDPVHVNLFSLEGQCIYQKDVSKLTDFLNLTNLRTGKYILEVNNMGDKSATLIMLE